MALARTALLLLIEWIFFVEVILFPKQIVSFNIFLELSISFETDKNR